MKRAWAAMWLAVTWLPLPSTAQTPDVERGERLYDICGACHGPHAQGNQTLLAPPLAGQLPAYLLRQLKHFHAGIRGAKGDIQASEMQQILATIPNESEWRDVVGYLKSLPAEPSTATVPGTGARARGEELYRSCAACHGAKGEGNESLDGPNLAILPPWYIASQLKKFKDGARGASAEDELGARMRAATAALGSDKDIAAVSAYIGSAAIH